MSLTVGIIANPSAGKDIRRLVAQGRVVSNQEKANILRRVFAGLVSSGVERVIIMPDMSGLARPAMYDCKGQIDAEFLDLAPTGSQDDSTRAAAAMSDMGVSCVVTLGGDGTNRVVSKGLGDVPIVPISTGTNNVFPRMTEGTLAGLAAGAIATGVVSVEEACRRSKRLDVIVDGVVVDLALVDAAVSHQMFVGARAVWELQSLHSMFLTRAEPASIGLSSIGARLRQIAIDEPLGLYLRFDGEPDETATRVTAPVGPGLVSSVDVMAWRVLELGDSLPVDLHPGTVALDGEREVELLPGRDVAVRLEARGPLVVDVEKTMALAAARR
ncbi:MAG: NAD(+)/NADH kinase [Chloroflexi bacterium]|nr:NAD(+)/NADH kinase [Chloroflexota bacterium]